MSYLTKEQMDAIENRFTLEWFNELTQVCAICDIEKSISEYLDIHPALKGEVLRRVG